MSKESTSRAKSAIPWVVTVGLCAILLWPFHDPEGRAALADAVGRASVWTIPVIVVLQVLGWLTDAYATGATYRHFGVAISNWEICLVRGASLLFDAVNPSLGQLVIAIMMYRRGAPLAKTVQVSLVLNVVFVIELLCFGGVGLLLGDYAASGLTERSVLGALIVSAVYVLLLAIKPQVLVRRKSLSNLFDAGLHGHAVAFAARIPSMATMFLFAWATMKCFRIDVPTSAVIVFVPALILITGLPISVQGIGPAQVAQVAFFTKIIGGDPRSTEALVLAWGLTYSIGSALGSFVVGVGCMFTKVGRQTFAARREVEALQTEGSVA